MSINERNAYKNMSPYCLCHSINMSFHKHKQTTTQKQLKYFAALYWLNVFYTLF